MYPFVLTLSSLCYSAVMHFYFLVGSDSEMTHVLVKWDFVIHQSCGVSFSESALQNINTFFFFTAAVHDQPDSDLPPAWVFHQLLFKFAQHFEYLPSKGVAALSLQLILSLFSALVASGKFLCVSLLSFLAFATLSVWNRLRVSLVSGLLLHIGHEYRR